MTYWRTSKPVGVKQEGEKRDGSQQKIQRHNGQDKKIRGEERQSCVAAKSPHHSTEKREIYSPKQGKYASSMKKFTKKSPDKVSEGTL